MAEVEGEGDEAWAGRERRRRDGALEEKESRECDVEVVVEAGREKSYGGAEGVPHGDGLRDSANCLSSTAHYWTKNWL